MTDFMVAIPTYNGSKRLNQLIESLRSQIGTEHFSWRILVVDNNSTDDTAAVVKERSAAAEGIPVDYAFEPRQGAAFARVKAMAVATSQWVGFLDDDVIPNANWVAEAYAFGTSHPKVGAFGGKILGAFEVEPPANFSRIKSFLALRDRGPHPHRYQPETLSLPPSAAWVVCAQAWHENVSSQPRLGGRTNGSMVQGDDYEPLLYMHKANWEIWYNPTMQVHHQIPKGRLERSYLMPLSRGCGLCICQLRMIGQTSWQRPIIWLKLILSNLRRVLAHWLKYRTQLEDDLVAACEMEFYLGSLISPFYYLKTRLSGAGTFSTQRSHNSETTARQT